MWGCSCLGDDDADHASESVATSQGGRGLMQEGTCHQSYYCLVVIDFSMAGNRDAHRHLGGITANRVIGGDCWLAYYLSSQVFVGMDPCVQALLCYCCECSQEW